MRSQPKTRISKFFRIWTFALLFAITNIPNKPAWAFLSTVDSCLQQPQCAGAIAEELAPIIATPAAEAGGTVAISATTATGVTTTSEAVAGVAVVGDVRLSGVLAYHVWQSGQNKQAQEKAKQRYCEAYPTDEVCGSIGGQSPGVSYWAVATAVSAWNCQMLQSAYGFQLEYCDDSSGYRAHYDLSHRLGAGIQDLKGPVQFLGFRQALDQFNQGCWFMDVLTADGYRSERQVCNYGPWLPPPGKMKFAGMLRMDGQPDTGGNQPPLPWKDWPQEKRSIAIAAIKQPDWQEFIKSMPEGGRLIPGDRLNAPVIVLPGLDTDDPNTPQDETLPTKKPNFLDIPEDDFDYDGNPDDSDTDDDNDGLPDTSDPAPRNSVVPTASDDDDSLISEPGELVPGTPEHKADRWVKYQDKQGTWDYERWSKNYDQNMVRATNANAVVDVYRNEIGWGEREVTVKAGVENRRLDIADEKGRRGVEYKTGYVTKSPDINSEVSRDAVLVKQGWAIEWVFQGSASKPLLQDLSDAGITYTFRTP